MAAAVQGLSDKAVAVFAFAAYHQLESGQKVSRVVQRDGAGHKADEEAIAELHARGLVTANGQSIQFTPQGETVLETVIQGLQRTLNGG
jgi:coproporphyrinogen III oxidase-like Fe-S oxidoreductase